MLIVGKLIQIWGIALIAFGQAGASTSGDAAGADSSE